MAPAAGFELATKWLTGVTKCLDYQCLMRNPINKKRLQTTYYWYNSWYSENTIFRPVPIIPTALK